MSTDEFSEDIWVMDDRDDSPERGEWNPDPEEVPQLAPEIPTWKNGGTPESSIGFNYKPSILGIPHLWHPPIRTYIHTKPCPSDDLFHSFECESDTWFWHVRSKS
jgi:hypothetical protein